MTTPQKKRSKKRRYEKRKAAGLCPWGACPTAPYAGRVYCANHGQMMDEASAKAKRTLAALGLCEQGRGCGEKRVEGSPYCEIHRAARREKRLAFRKAHGR